MRGFDMKNESAGRLGDCFSKKRMKRAAKELLLGLTGCLCVFPVAVVFFRSFMSVSESYSAFHLIPQKWTVYSYEKILLLDSEIYTYFWNSVRYTAIILLFALPVSLLAGYGFARFRYRGRNALFVFYIVLMILPFQATLVPQYLTLKALGLLDTRAAVILPNVFGAFGAVLMTQYMQGIDSDLLDAGRIDGLSGFWLFLRLVVPLCKPAASAYLVLAFIDNWNMIEQPNIFLRNIELYPLSLRLFSLQADGVLAGGIVFAVLPVLIFGYQREAMVEGISLGSIK